MPEPNWKIDNCGSCFRPIIWAITKNAKSMPVDAEAPTTGGNVALEYRGPDMQPLARVLTVAQQFGRTGLRLPHFASCPQGRRWSNKTRTRAGKASP